MDCGDEQHQGKRRRNCLAGGDLCIRKDRDALLHNIGKRLCETRKLQGISQAELAEKADLSVVYISNIEAGKKNISVDVLLRLCSALNMPSDFLLRADLARSVQLTYGIDTIFANCSEEEIESILLLLRDIKIIIEKAKTTA